MPDITRRDFLDGLAIAAGAAWLGCSPPDPADTFAPEAAASYYPPALTGMRGSHPGSFEVAHQMRDGALKLDNPRNSRERYDLVVVGAGISGLAAAYYYRKAKPDARILILDNHDDVGGHAKRNEFTVNGRLVMSYGGTESVESPAQYSATSRALLAELGIDLQRFYTAFDQERYHKLGLGHGIFFDKETFGVERLVRGGAEEPTRGDLAQVPLAEPIRRDILRAYQAKKDFFPGLSDADKKAKLARMSYLAYLRDVLQLSPKALPFFQPRTQELYGVGIDAVPALDCWGLGYPGFDGLKLDAKAPAPGIGRTALLEMHEEEPYIFHFPDGNAGIARILLRALVPNALAGTTMDDEVTSRLAYAQLDLPTNPVRVRLNSTAVKVAHDGPAPSAREVVVTYVRGGTPVTVRGANVVLAGWNMAIPYLCPELPADQKKALSYGVKVPIVYTNVALTNWWAFQKARVHDIYSPGSWFMRGFLDYPVDLGAYQSAHSPEQPIVFKFVRTPCHPGVPSRDQHRIGRAELLATPFETFEHHVQEQLTRMLGSHGFDIAAIAAITVNRWSHGYSYEYNSLWDGPFEPGQEPCVLGRATHGRIAIANADADAYAYTNAAIDQAWRAVSELAS